MAAGVDGAPGGTWTPAACAAATPPATGAPTTGCPTTVCSALAFNATGALAPPAAADKGVGSGEGDGDDAALRVAAVATALAANSLLETGPTTARAARAAVCSAEPSPPARSTELSRELLSKEPSSKEPLALLPGSLGLTPLHLPSQLPSRLLLPPPPLGPAARAADARSEMPESLRSSPGGGGGVDESDDATGDCDDGGDGDDDGDDGDDDAGRADDGAGDGDVAVPAVEAAAAVAAAGPARWSALLKSTTPSPPPADDGGGNATAGGTAGGAGVALSSPQGPVKACAAASWLALPSESREANGVPSGVADGERSSSLSVSPTGVSWRLTYLMTHSHTNTHTHTQHTHKYRQNADTVRSGKSTHRSDERLGVSVRVSRSASHVRAAGRGTGNVPRLLEVR